MRTPKPGPFCAVTLSDDKSRVSCNLQYVVVDVTISKRLGLLPRYLYNKLSTPAFDFSAGKLIEYISMKRLRVDSLR